MYVCFFFYHMYKYTIKNKKVKCGAKGNRTLVLSILQKHSTCLE